MGVLRTAASYGRKIRARVFAWNEYALTAQAAELATATSGAVTYISDFFANTPNAVRLVTSLRRYGPVNVGGWENVAIDMQRWTDGTGQQRISMTGSGAAIEFVANGGFDFSGQIRTNSLKFPAAQENMEAVTFTGLTDANGFVSRAHSITGGHTRILMSECMVRGGSGEAVFLQHAYADGASIVFRPAYNNAAPANASYRITLWISHNAVGWT